MVNRGVCIPYEESLLMSKPLQTTKVCFHVPFPSFNNLREQRDFPGAQWMRICLPMQRKQVRWLFQEDSTFCRAAKPVCHKLQILHVLCNEKTLTATRESPWTAMKTQCSQN